MLFHGISENFHSSQFPVIHPIVVEIFQSGPNGWTGWPTLPFFLRFMQRCIFLTCVTSCQHISTAVTIKKVCKKWCESINSKCQFYWRSFQTCYVALDFKIMMHGEKPIIKDAEILFQPLYLLWPQQTTMHGSHSTCYVLIKGKKCQFFSAGKACSVLTTLLW